MSTSLGPSSQKEEATGLSPTAVGGLRRRVGNVSFDLYRFGTRCLNKATSLLVSGGFLAYGRRSVIQLPFRIRGEQWIQVGSDVFIGAGSWLQVEGEGHGGVVMEIGDGTSIAGSCVISAARSVRVGRNVLMARNVYIADHMHAFERIGEPILSQGIDRIAPIEIGDGAWIGQNVVVGPGVRIGRGAVVGANSVVLADVPDFTVVAGAPAHVIRTLGGAPAASP